MDEGHFIYLDDDGKEQGPFPVSSVISWVQSGFFDGSRRVKRCDVEESVFVPLVQVPELAQYLPVQSAAAAPAASSSTVVGVVGEEGLVPLSEEERLLSEYYKNFYAQAFAKAAADYQAQLEEYTRQQEALKQSQEENSKKRGPPDDGYVVPKPQFEDYRMAGKFSKLHGKFMAEGQGGSELRNFFFFYVFFNRQNNFFRKGIGPGREPNRIEKEDNLIITTM